MRNEEKNATGAASMYMVMFSMMVVSVIMLGFMNLMLSESQRTINDNLYQTAYDSATSGMDDAERFLREYLSCTTNNGVGVVDCAKVITAYRNNSSDCMAISKYLYGNTESSEHVLGSQTALGDTINQAYTCIKISGDGGRFESTVDNYGAQTVPLDLGDKVSSATYFSISWGSLSGHSAPITYYHDSGKIGQIKQDTDEAGNPNTGIHKGLVNTLYADITSPGNYNVDTKGIYDAISVPQVISVEFFQTGQNEAASGYSLNEFSREQFYTTIDNGSEHGTNRAHITLVPSSNSSLASINTKLMKYSSDKGGNVITADTMLYSADKSENYPVTVYCDPDGLESSEYQCTALFQIPKAVNMSNQITSAKNPTTMMVRVLNPLNSKHNKLYYTLSVYEGDDIEYLSNIGFNGNQYTIEVTGRANDVFRRIQRVVEAPSGNGSYTINQDDLSPRFSLAVTGSDSTLSIYKDFMVTENCYSTVSNDGNCSNLNYEGD